LQPEDIGIYTWNQLLRFKGLATLQYVLMFGPHPSPNPFYNPQSWVRNEEMGFQKAKLKNLVELPQLRSVSIALRTFSYDQPMLEGGTEQVPDLVKDWVASTERRMMGGKNPQSGQ
jgi:hypothetical protein